MPRDQRMPEFAIKYIWRCLLIAKTDWEDFIINGNFIISLSSSSVYSAQAQVFHFKLRNQGCSSAQRQIFHRILRNSRYFPYPTLYLAFEHIIRDLERSQGLSVEMRREDLANWALWTSPNFTTGVKYQFHQGLWPNQRSRIPNHSSPLHIMYFIVNITWILLLHTQPLILIIYYYLCLTVGTKQSELEAYFGIFQT